MGTSSTQKFAIVNTAKKIEDAMKAARMTRPELIQKSGVPKSTLSQILSGEREMGPKVAAKLAAALGASTAELLGLDSPREQNLALIRAASNIAETLSETPEAGQKIFDSILENWVSAQTLLRQASENIAKAGEAMALAARSIQEVTGKPKKITIHRKEFSSGHLDVAKGDVEDALDERTGKGTGRHRQT